MELSTNTPVPDRTHGYVRWLVLTVWVSIIAIGFIAIERYNADEKVRTMRLWEQRLAMVANHHAGQIAERIGKRTNSLKAVADNVSTRLYLTTLRTDNAGDTEAEITFLRNYIFAVAEQADLAFKESDATTIPANVAVAADRGLAIVHADSRPVVSTRHFPSFEPVASALLNTAQPLVMIGPLHDRDHPGQDGRIWIAVPIYAVQADAGKDKPIGWVIGTFLALSDFDAILAKGELPNSPATSLLVGEIEGKSQILAPRSHRDQPLQSTQYEVLAAVAHKEHDKLLDGLDTGHQPALAYAAAVGDTGWSVVREVTSKAALSDTKKRGQRLLWLFWLAVLAVSVTVYALWQHVIAQRLQQLLAVIRNHERLLELVTEHIPARLFITDDQHRYRYVNREAALEARMTREDILGKTLVQVMGTATAQPYMDTNARVLDRGLTETVLHEKSNEQRLEYAARVQHVPLDDLPESYADGGQSVLVIEEDLTEVMQAKYAHQQSLKKLIDTIVALADKRDPHAAYHSAGVAMIARAIAETMRIDRPLIDTAGIAGQLMNLGKLFIPQEILTSQKQIDRQDKQLIAQSLQMAIEHLADVPFEGPVVETLRQAQEKPDGSGPLGLQEDTILITARILAVANSFVALTSDRSYRDRLSMDEALATLNQQSDRAYDATVIAALTHYLKNIGGEAQWQAFIDKQS